MNKSNPFSITYSKEHASGPASRCSRSLFPFAGGLASVLLLASCGGITPHPELEALQTRYEIMSGEAYASQEASDELASTRGALMLGREAYQEGDEDALRHHIFVADKNLDIAEVRIDLFTANTAIASASETRERLMREIRELQLARAESDASTAEAVAELREEALATQQLQLTRQQQELLEQEQELEEAENELAVSRYQFEATQERANALAAELAAVSMRESERGTVLVLSDIVFDPESANLQSGSERVLDEVAEFLVEQDAGPLRIEGHTDALGTEYYNLELSRDRADAVRDALVSRGVDPDRILIDGYGEAYPVASNDTDAGRQLNRRVEIVLNDRTGRPDISRYSQPR